MTDDPLSSLKSRMAMDKSLPYPGWNNIIITCNRKLEMLDPDYRILQIKEKFGTLRYYYHTDVKIHSIREAMDRYVRQAEVESSKTCEFCGKPGKLIKCKMAWMKTRCDDCAPSDAVILESL